MALHLLKGAWWLVWDSKHKLYDMKLTLDLTQQIFKTFFVTCKASSLSHLEISTWVSSGVWPTPHGAAAAAKFLLCGKWQRSSTTPTGIVSVILTGQRDSSFSPSLRAFYQCLLMLLGALHKETCHWEQKTSLKWPPCSPMPPRGRQVSSPFVTFRNNMIKGIAFWFPFTVGELSRVLKFCLGRKHC